MKRFLVCVCFVVMVLAPVSARSFGYGLGYYGQTVETQPDLTSSGLELSLVYKPWNLAFANPSIIAKTAIGTDMNGAFRIPYVQIGFDLDLFRTINHPFNFMAGNIIAYSPMVGVSYVVDPGRNKHVLALEISALKMIQKDFWYEVLSPFMLYDLGEGKTESWGFNLIRFTYFLE